MPTIQPSIGRRVWYWPSVEDLAPKTYGVEQPAMYQADPVQPFDAGVAFVCADTDQIFVSVADHSGQLHSRGPVQIRDPHGPWPVRESRWQWMPYQLGQAAKAA